MASLPTGTVTFLFSDIEGSTRLLAHLGDRYPEVLERHHQILRAIFLSHNGHEVDTQGDAFFVAFSSARDALAAAVGVQLAILGHPWPDHIVVRVRIGLHSGEALLAAGSYVGLDVHRAARIAAAGYGGQTLLSEVTYALVKDNPLESMGFRDLGLHTLKDLERPEHIYQVTHRDLPKDFPPLKSIAEFPNNLPIQLTSFVGREREMREISRALSQARIVTLTGAPGSGKTRLGIQAAAKLLGEFPDGVYIVQLAPVETGDMVLHAVAAALGIRQQAGQSVLESLFDALRVKRLLLLLDNCEHLLSACAQLATVLLKSCPNLRILATSREILRIEGEVNYLLHPLPVPGPQHPPAVEQLMQFDSVRLFLDRARLVAPTFEITEENAPAVARICVQLDGIPLALELAAALIMTLSANEMGDRLTERFRLLTKGARTAVPRHQTMWAAIEWSYGLLEPREQMVFRRLSVFVGDVSLAAAEAICAGDGIDRADVAALIGHLVEKSLVLPDTQGVEARYRLLATLREFGRNQLVAAGEEFAVQRRHASYFLEVATVSLPELVQERQAYWLARLDSQHEDLLMALEWYRVQGEAEWGLKIATALAWFWSTRGHFSEGQERIEYFLALPGNQARTGLRGWGLIGLAMLLHHLGRFSDAASHLQEAFSIFEQLKDDAGISVASSNMANVMVSQGDHSAALERYRSALPLFERLGHRRGVAATLNNMGNVARIMGDVDQAESLMRQSLAISREIGDMGSVARTLDNLGRLALEREDLDLAQSLMQESLELAKELGDRYTIAGVTFGLAQVPMVRAQHKEAAHLLEDSLILYEQLGAVHGVAAALGSLGELSLRAGSDREAIDYYAKGIRLFDRIGDKWGLAKARIGLGNALFNTGNYRAAREQFREALMLAARLVDSDITVNALSGLGRIAAIKGMFIEAARLYGASERIREVSGPIPAYILTEYETVRTHLRKGMDEGTLKSAWHEGRGLVPEKAIEYALSLDLDP